MAEEEFRNQIEPIATGPVDQYGASTIRIVRPGVYKMSAFEREEGQKESRQLTVRPANSAGN